MTKIQLRHDTAANFASENPILLAGEAAIETDTNKMKIGDGTTAYNSLEYFGGEAPDLSNYYNKTQVNGLLNEKQDKLTPNSPLTITEYIKSNLVGLNYTGDGKGVYTQQAYESTTGSQFLDSNTFPLRMYDCGRGITVSAKEWFWGCGYIDIPYTIGQVICSGKRTNNGTYRSNCILGKYVDGDFVPITSCLSNSSQYAISTSDTGSYTQDGRYSYVYTPDNSTYTGSGTNVPVNTESGRQYGMCFQLAETALGVNMFSMAGTYANIVSITNSDLVTRLKEITVARIVPIQDAGQTSSLPLNIEALGVYNYAETIDSSAKVETIAAGNDVLGENLFDVSGATAQNYLDLNIGNGLAVQNGNLVNTNPTPVTVDQTYDATSANAQSGTAVAEAVEDKVDNSELVDISELYPTLSGLGMPSYTYTSLTLNASGSNYTAPADGWITLQVNATAAGQGVFLVAHDQQGQRYWGVRATSSIAGTQYLNLLLPVVKGQVFEVAYSTAGSAIDFKFIYAVGSESEAS